MILLEVEDLAVGFPTRAGLVHAVDSVSISVDRGAALAIVGESGCGKSVTALSIMGLLPRSARVQAGRIRFEGRDLLALKERELDGIRGNEIGMVFQDPLSSLNPSLTVGGHLVQTLRRHLGMGRAEARERAVELLEEVRIANAARRLGDYAHQLSGGMCQRVMIALAIACKPRLLIADEPTTALDVTVQAQILDLLEELRHAHQMAMIVITHDMGVVAETADHVAVMYAGEIVERATVNEIFEHSEHPYTEALLASLLQLDTAGPRPERLTAIPGRPPELIDPPPACRFSPRCPHAGLGDACAREHPALSEIRPGHMVRSAHPRSAREGAVARAGTR